MSREKKWGALALLIPIIGTLFGNLLVCLAVCFNARLRNKNNYFLMSLAIADLLVALLVMPFGLLVELEGSFPLDWWVCSLWSTMDVLLCTASIWHMSMISVDRLLSLKYPFTCGRNKTVTTMVVKIVITWAIATLIGGGVFIISLQDTGNVYNAGACVITNKHFIIYGSVMAFCVPLAIIIATNILTIRILYNGKSSSVLCKVALSADRIQPEKKALKVLGIIFLVFCVLWTPFFITNLIGASDCDVCKTHMTNDVMTACLWLGYCSSMANPIVYTIFSVKFRNTFLEILQGKACRGELIKQQRFHSVYSLPLRTNTLPHDGHTVSCRSNSFPLPESDFVPPQTNSTEARRIRRLSAHL